MEKIPVTIHFGAATAPISKQLRKHKAPYDKDVISFLQKLADAVTQIAVGNLLSPTIITTARKRILNRISSHVNKQVKRKKK